MYRVQVRDHIAAPIDAVFEHFIDYPHFFRGKDISSSTMAKEGTEERYGLGAFRRIVWVSNWSVSIPLLGWVIERVLGPQTTEAFTAMVRQAKGELED